KDLKKVIIRVQGKFSIIKTEVDRSKIKLIKMVASDICVLNLEEDDLPKLSLSITLVGTASNNSETNDDKVILKLNAREYIDNQNNKSLSFDLYHFSEESHLLPITNKVLHESSLYITGSLSLIDDLLLVRLTQINFIENTRSSLNKTSSYAWEKREEKESTTQSIL
ncbi:12999_t:CDS:2, partial [Funneliformis geosporum]